MARENDISVDEEAEIREAFRLFSRPLPKRRRDRRRHRRSRTDNDDGDEEMGDVDDDDDSEDGDDGEGVISSGDVRRALMFVANRGFVPFPLTLR